MKYDQLPQNLNIQVIVPVNGAQQPGGALQAFTACQAVQAPNYGVPIGAAPPQMMPHVAGAGPFINLATPGQALQSLNLITCALVVYIYTNGGGVIQHITAYHAHTGSIPANDLPLGANFRPGHNPNHVHVVFATSQDDHPGQPLMGIQTASQGLVDVLNSGIPANNIKVILGTGTSFGVNLQGDVGRTATPMFVGNDLPARVTVALGTAAARFAQAGLGMGPQPTAQQRYQLLQQILQIGTGQPHGPVRDQTLLNALNAFFAGVLAFPPGSFDLFFVEELEGEIWGAHAQVVNPMNAGQRLQRTRRAIEVGIRQLI